MPSEVPFQEPGPRDKEMVEEKPKTLLEDLEEQLKFYEKQVDYAKNMISLLKANPAIQEFHDKIFERENVGRRLERAGKIRR